MRVWKENIYTIGEKSEDAKLTTWKDKLIERFRVTMTHLQTMASRMKEFAEGDCSQYHRITQVMTWLGHLAGGRLLAEAWSKSTSQSGEHNQSVISLCESVRADVGSFVVPSVLADLQEKFLTWVDKTFFPAVSSFSTFAITSPLEVVKKGMDQWVISMDPKLPSSDDRAKFEDAVKSLEGKVPGKIARVRTQLMISAIRALQLYQETLNCRTDDRWPLSFELINKLAEFNPAYNSFSNLVEAGVAQAL